MGGPRLEAKTNRIEYLKLKFPTIFSRETFLKSALTAAEITGNDLDMAGRHIADLGPIKAFNLSEERLSKPDAKGRVIDLELQRFVFGKVDAQGFEPIFGISYYRRLDDTTGTSDKFIINLNAKGKRILFDLKENKVGIGAIKNNFEPILLKNYDTVFDLKDPESLKKVEEELEKLKKDIKVFGFELTEDLVAFRIMGGDFKSVMGIVLPRTLATEKVDVKKSATVSAQAKRTKRPAGKLQMHQDGSKIMQFKETPVSVLGRELTLSRDKRQRIVVDVKDFSLTLDEIKILFEFFVKKSNDPGFMQVATERKRSAKELFEEAKAAGLMDENFIQELEKTIKSLKI